MRATLVGLADVAFFLLVPLAIGRALAGGSTVTPLTQPSFIYAYGAIITGLQVLAALTRGMALSVPFNSGSYLVSAFYIWQATEGGRIVVSANGMEVTLGFLPLVYLLMLPSIFNALRTPITFLLEESEVARPVPDEL